MSKLEWYRRSTWTNADQADVDTRLKRTRDAGNKSQYLCIQAFHLAESGLHREAIALLDRMFAEFPGRISLASAHLQKAESLARLGDVDAAIAEFRAAFQSQRDVPNVQTTADLDFGWFVLEKELTDHYEEAAEALTEFRDRGGLQFPHTEYRYCAIIALLADHSGERAIAREYAQRALSEAAKQHSGFRYHPKVGLVGAESETFTARLRSLAQD